MVFTSGVQQTVSMKQFVSCPIEAPYVRNFCPIAYEELSPDILPITTRVSLEETECKPQRSQAPGDQNVMRNPKPEDPVKPPNP